MDGAVWIVIAVIVVIAIAIAVYMAMRKKRTERLQGRFGPEYERALNEKGDRKSAEAELGERERRRAKLDVRELDPREREEFSARWTEVQTRFVDQPGTSVKHADTLVQEVMRARGYPVDDFEQRAADVSVDHPQVAENYRAAHAISLANDHERATTEDLRQAMVHYRALFDELLGSHAHH
ncbi:MAG TPA: hypothetical protein VHJ34_04595 [Actinomycetota bacterium]|nr:hypothetical protein [Actinomycetota bacterium]